jgi:uncharacterized LabA/DUF88 family protein
MVRPAVLQPFAGLESYFAMFMSSAPPSLKPKRVIAFIDGYNLYHAIDDAGRHDLKWLNLWELSEALIRNDRRAELVEVLYFSAFATWKPEQYARHRHYVAALKSAGVKIILGNFKRKPRKCNRCLNEWTAHEEKESDVNIAIHLLDKAQRDEYDEALLLTADTDLTPAIRLVRERYRSKSIVSVLPPGRQYVGSLIDASSSKIRLSFELLERCQFVDQLVTPNGETINIPDKYRRKAG